MDGLYEFLGTSNYPNVIKGNYRNGKKVGYWEITLWGGSILRKENYRDGVLDGLYETYGSLGLEDQSCYKEGISVVMSYCDWDIWEVIFSDIW